MKPFMLTFQGPRKIYPGSLGMEIALLLPSIERVSSA